MISRVVQQALHNKQTSPCAPSTTNSILICHSLHSGTISRTALWNTLYVAKKFIAKNVRVNRYWNVTSKRMLPLYAIHWAASGVLQLHSCHSSDYKFLWLGLFSFPWTCRKTRPMKMTLECTFLVSMYVFLFSTVKKKFYKKVK